MASLPSRRWLVRGLLGLLVVSLLLLSGVLTLSYQEPTLRTGVTDSSPESDTVISSQGWNARGVTLPDRPARLVSVGQNGTINWMHNGPDDRRSWFYDVDLLPNGNLLVVNPIRGTTVVYEFDPRSQKRVWTERFDRPDIHDVDLINGDELLVAGISYDTSPVSDDRVFIYNRTLDVVTWEWRFANHYSHEAGPGVDAKDWTHVNDVDKIREGEFLVSVRNLDQVIVINRSTKDIEMRLGEDGNHSMLFEQHNPDYLESDNGTPTILVADSENDRIVEYARVGEDEWKRTWTLSGGLNWPRDADRLPNGNTLVVDSMNHRVIEVTPRGEIVWEMYAPWATYDAERMVHDDGPTITDLNASGSVTLHGGSQASTPLPTVPSVVRSVVAGTPLSAELTGLAVRWKHVSPWVKPTWLPTWAFSIIVVCLLITLHWAIGEGVYHHRRIRRRIADSLGTVRNRLSRLDREQ